jgi:hypothetical protein
MSSFSDRTINYPINCAIVTPNNINIHFHSILNFLRRKYHMANIKITDLPDKSELVSINDLWELSDVEQNDVQGGIAPAIAIGIGIRLFLFSTPAYGGGGGRGNLPV